MPSFGSKSKAALGKCHPLLQAIANEAIGFDLFPAPYDWNMEHGAYEVGFRECLGG